MRLGLSDQPFATPLQNSLLAGLTRDNWHAVVQSPWQNSRDLLAGKLDAALLTPLDFARNSSKLSLARTVGICSYGASGYAQLLFRDNLQKMEQIAVLEQDTQYHYLAKVVLGEFYDVDCEWSTASAAEGPEELLKKYPAVLLEGESALQQAGGSAALIDLTEVWSDQTDAPFVHLLLATRDNADSVETLRDLLQSYRPPEVEGIRQNATDKDAAIATYLVENYRYQMDDVAWEALHGWLEFMFYYGWLEFIPGITFID